MLSRSPDIGFSKGIGNTRGGNVRGGSIRGGSIRGNRYALVSKYSELFQTAPSSKTFPIWTGKIGINTFSQSATTNVIKTAIGWDESNWELVSALMSVDAYNSDAAGGSMHIYMNGADVLDLDWCNPADFTCSGTKGAGDQTGSADVSSQLQNGTNEFFIEYDVNGVLGALGRVNAWNIVVTLKYIGSSTKPPTPWTPSFVLTTTDYIIIGVAAAVLSLGGIALITRPSTKGPEVIVVPSGVR